MARLLYREPVTEQPVPSTVILHKDEEFRGYWVEVPALLGCVSQGKSKEAIALQLECMKEDGAEIPKEKSYKVAVEAS